jgi:PelA/Pel-15E family pectate lyase
VVGLTVSLAGEAGGRAPQEPIDLRGFADGIHHARMGLMMVDYPVYEPHQFVEIADNLLLYQNDDGGWPKNQDVLRVVTPEEVAALAAQERRRRGSTLDNHNTYPQIEYLSRAYSRSGFARFRAAAHRGIDYVLGEQRPSGGWRGADVDAITFNDSVMVGTLRTLTKVAEGVEPFAWVWSDVRERARAAVDRGIACILRSQFVLKGELTAWGQQHDHDTFLPVGARSYELAAITAAESVGVVEYLMDLEHPSDEVIRAIEGAVAWFERARIMGIRVETIRIDPIKYPAYIARIDRVVVGDPAARPMWARFYDLERGEPFFANRDGSVVKTLAEVDHERRAGYLWLSYWPERVLNQSYPRWRARRAAALERLQEGR